MDNDNIRKIILHLPEYFNKYSTGFAVTLFVIILYATIYTGIKLNKNINTFTFIKFLEII